MDVKNSLQVVLPWSLSLPRIEGARRQFHETTICIYEIEKLLYLNRNGPPEIEKYIAGPPLEYVEWSPLMKFCI